MRALLLVIGLAAAHGARFAPARGSAAAQRGGSVGVTRPHRLAAAAPSPARSLRRVRMAAGGGDEGKAVNAKLAVSDEAGKWILGAVLLGNLWLFSVPPEIRRTHVCTTDQSMNKRIKKMECVQESEWRAMVARHYQTCKSFGECVHFDFSVDPKTQEFNAKMLDTMRTGKR